MAEVNFRIGIIGHRDLGNQEKHSNIHYCCHRLLKEVIQKHPKVIAISAISDGADSIFAHSAISLNIPLETIIPFKKFADDFEQGAPYTKHQELRKISKHETKVNFSGRSKFAYKKSMEWLVFKSNIIVAIWDGKKIGSIGGTWEAVSLCMKINKTLVHINSESNKISLYVNIGDRYECLPSISLKEIVRYL